MKIIFTFLIIILATLAIGQNVESKTFYNISEKYYDCDTCETIKRELWNFLDLFPKSNFEASVFYKLASISRNQDSLDLAIVFFKKAVEAKVPKYYYNNDKYYSCRELAEIYVNKKDFKSALKYIKLIKKKYPLITGNHNYREFQKFDISELYYECYLGIGNFKNAIKDLAALMFNKNLFFNDTLMKVLYSSYLKHHTKEEIKNEFLNAEKTFEINIKKINSVKSIYPTIKIFKKKIFIPVYLSMELDDIKRYNYTDEQIRQDCLEMIKKSAIYKIATK